MLEGGGGTKLGRFCFLSHFSEAMGLNVNSDYFHVADSQRPRRPISRLTNHYINMTTLTLGKILILNEGRKIQHSKKPSLLSICYQTKRTNDKKSSNKGEVKRAEAGGGGRRSIFGKGVWPNLGQNQPQGGDLTNESGDVSFFSFSLIHFEDP